MKVPVEAQNKAAHVLAAKIPDHIIGLFVEPVLLEGEDPQRYWNMVSAMIDEHQPQGFLDWIALNDLVTAIWEELAYRRASNAIIRGGQRMAVQQFMEEILLGVDVATKDKDRAYQKADKYFRKDPAVRGPVRSQLATFGIGEAELLARSAQNNSDAILMFERLVSSRERGRRKLQKKMSRRGSSQEVKPETYAGANAHRQRPRGSCQEAEVPERVGSEPHHHGLAAVSRELAATASEEFHFHHMSKSRSCQDVKAEADRDEDQHNVERSGTCQEVAAKMVGSHHHGH